MEGMITFVQPFFDWLLQTTVIASLVICLIVAFQKTLGGRLGPRWCHALWLVLIVRMVLPWAPSSRLSLFNLVPSWDRQVQRQQPSETTKGQGIHEPARTADAVDEPTTQGPESEVVIREQAAPEPLTVGDVPTELRSWPISLRPVLSILWLAGAMVIGAYILVSDFALWWIVKRDRVLVNQEMLELFEQCKEKMDVQSLVAVVPSDEVRSPGLFGFVRPRLLLPREMLDTATHEEMRYVFLHELAHLKRRDIYLGWLTSLLQILHWFNPLVWFAFYRMRMDRELACDALVLTRTGQDKSHEYGGAILGLLRRFSRPRRLPAMAGIVENRSQLKRRIAMITQFKKNSYKWSPLAVMLIVVLACISLPNSEHIIASETSGPMVAAQPTFTKIRIPTETPWSMQLSPDGRKVSLVSDKKLWIMPTRGKLGLDIPGEPVAVNTAGVLVEWTGHAWSADGKWIAFNELMPMRRNTPERKGKQSIYVVSSEGGRPTKVCETYPGERTPNYRISLSPGGETVAFSSVGVEGKEQHIYTIPVGGGEPRRLVDIQAREPVFSPDGTMIAFVEDSNGGRRGGGLCVVSAQGGTPNRIADAVYASSPVWSHGGDMIAFLDYAANERQINIVRIADDARGVGETIQINAPEGIQGVWLLAGWSPDGKIGAIFKRPAETGLYTLSAKGGKAMQVARGGRIPRWFPDGTRISCVDSPKKSKGMWHGLALGSVPAEGGMFVAIPLQSDTKMGLAGFGVGNRVSPDGKKIVFSGKVQGKPPVFSHNHVWTVPVEGGTPKQLSEATEGTTHMFPCWSPDGKTVAFIRGKMPDILSSMSAIRTDICTVPAGGGKPSVLTTVSDGVNFGPIAWSPDGNRIAYYSETDRASSTVILKTVSANGEGRVRIIGTVDEPHYGKEFAWSPDSKRIAFNGPDGKTISIMSVEDGSTVNIETGLIDSNVGTQLDWSHDGARLVFVGGKGESSEFWTMENFLPQTPVVKPAHKPHFRKIKIASKPKNGVLSPDGSKMAFVSEDAVWVVPLHGKVDPDIAGEPVRLAEAPGIWDNGSLMAWSADGKWIAVNAKPDEQDTVHVIPVAGGESRVVQMPCHPMVRCWLSRRSSLANLLRK